MGSFSASLRTFGDHKGLPATIQIDSGRLSIALGDQPLGDWALDEIHLEPIESGYRLEAEGDQVLLDLANTEDFEAVLNENRERPKRRLFRRNATGTVTSGKVPKPRGKPESARATREAKRPKEQSKKREPGTNTVLAALDGVLIRAENRWGTLLPGWFFTRAAALGLIAVLVVALLLPAFFSTALVVVGLCGVALGAVFYMDPILMAKWLPGRMAPVHVLVFAVTSIVLGVLLGIVAT